MKRFCIISAILLAAATFSAGAQGVEDALRYSQQFYVGSARTMAMGNAFTALGGDLGAIAINPASSALYNCCEFALTAGLSWDKNTADFYTTEGTYSSLAGPDRKRFTVPNISTTFSVPTGRSGLVSYSFGIGYNKLNNFNSHVAFSGNDNGTSLLGGIAAGLEGVSSSYLQDLNAFNIGYCTPQEIMAWDAYLIAPYVDEEGYSYDDSYIGATENYFLDGGLGVNNAMYKDLDLTTGGGIYDMSLNFGLNFFDRLYLGANVNINIVNFEENLRYSEQATAGNYFQSGFKSMDYTYWQRTDGAGVNLQLGAILIPVDFLRLGVSYTTKTVYDLTDSWHETMTSGFDGSNPEYASFESESPYRDYDYRIHAPKRLSLGGALVFGKVGLISADYEKVDYATTVMTDTEGAGFDDVNSDIRNYCYSCNIIRLGGELNIFGGTSLRAGYNRYVYDAPAYQYLSFGLGQRISENSSIDLAFRTRLDDYYEMRPYDDYAYTEAGIAQCVAPYAGISNSAYDVMLTYRVKF